MVIDWQWRAAALADRLDRAGVLDPAWRPAFAHTPRHVFVPAFHTVDGRRVCGDDPADRTAWLDAVYADESLVTQLRADPAGGPAQPTSSSTRPSLMALMLRLLDVHPGMQVLEIGTGTGYHAALLSHRLSAARLTSVDVDPELVAAASARLAGLGHQPHLVAGDGADGVPARAPFDRIIATCGVPGVPPAWIAQLRVGGVLVADLRSELASALAVVRRTAADRAVGRFRREPGHFMWLRHRADPPTSGGVSYDFTTPRETTTDIPPAAFADPDFLFVLHLAGLDLRPVGTAVRDGEPGIFLAGARDAAWVEIRAGAGAVADVQYGGPRALWPAVTRAFAWWCENGRPPRETFGFDITQGRIAYWRDTDRGREPVVLG